MDRFAVYWEAGLVAVARESHYSMACSYQCGLALTDGFRTIIMSSSFGEFKVKV